MRQSLTTKLQEERTTSLFDTTSTACSWTFKFIETLLWIAVFISFSPKPSADIYMGKRHFSPSIYYSVYTSIIVDYTIRRFRKK